MKRCGIGVALVAVVVSTLPIAAQVRISFDDARPVFAALGTNLPVGLRGRPLEDIRAGWVEWVAQHDREVRARLARGDEDSLVNFWLYGTSFTTQPPAVAGRSPAASVDGLATRRLDDLLAALQAPGSNERLRFAAGVFAAREIDPSTPQGREAARQFLVDARRRMIDEFSATNRELGVAARAGAATGAAASVFRTRGLSSDTSILADYSVSVALEAIARQRLLGPRQVMRAAVVGPGLDFTNKADGFDFYPEQTIQPFALVDTLRRHGLAGASLQMTTLDVSDRVTSHLRRARDRVGGYVLTLPLAGDEKWAPALLAYWKTAGRTVGDEMRSPRPAAAGGEVLVRSVRVRDDVVRAIDPRTLNVVVERLPLAPDERFDLVVATNVLLYYDVFEQALALANIASMLRPGGVLLTNTAALPTPPLGASASYLRVAHTPERYDEMFWYVRGGS
jgi:hypothetical protein